MKEDNLQSALEDMAKEWRTNDELERINNDLSSIRNLFLIFAASVVVWSAAITLTLHLIK